MPILTRKLLLHIFSSFLRLYPFILDKYRIVFFGTWVYFILHLKHGYLHISFPFYLLFLKKYYGKVSGFFLHGHEIFCCSIQIQRTYFIALFNPYVSRSWLFFLITKRMEQIRPELEHGSPISFFAPTTVTHLANPLCRRILFSDILDNENTFYFYIKK